MLFEELNELRGVQWMVVMTGGLVYCLVPERLQVDFVLEMWNHRVYAFHNLMIMKI